MISAQKQNEFYKAVNKMVELLVEFEELDADLSKMVATDYFLTSELTPEAFNQLEHQFKYVRQVQYGIHMGLLCMKYRDVIVPNRELMIVPKYELMVL